MILDINLDVEICRPCNLESWQGEQSKHSFASYFLASRSPSPPTISLKNGPAITFYQPIFSRETAELLQYFLTAFCIFVNAFNILALYDLIEMNQRYKHDIDS